LEDGVQILFDSPLMCEKGEFSERIFGQSIWDKSVPLFRTSWGKILETNFKKFQKIQRTSHPLQNKKNYHGSLESMFHLLSIMFISTFVSHHF
jgi:hypothetical protein